MISMRIWGWSYIVCIILLALGGLAVLFNCPEVVIKMLTVFAFASALFPFLCGILSGLFYCIQKKD